MWTHKLDKWSKKGWIKYLIRRQDGFEIFRARVYNSKVAFKSKKTTLIKNE